MVGNCDNSIIPSSSTNNQWPQNQITVVDDLMASSSNTNKAMAAAAAVDTSVPLKCPRCDSSNTKFCYYNNYSLSQPRHFCKACKRYWTRGGTLRNVPVGGGCRKNKRHKRHSSSSSSASAQAQIDLPLPPPPPSSSTSHIHNPLFYGGPLELSFPFSSFRVSSDDGGGGGFDGLGFSSEGNGYKNGFNLSSPFSSAADNNNNNNNSIFFGSSTMASLLSSTQKFKDFQAQALMPYEEPQMPGTGKQVKAEGENRFPWNPNYSNSNPNPNSNPMDQMNSSDPSSLVWNTSSISTWFDPSTMGSSVPSLI